MRAYGAKALAIAMAFILFIQPAAALTEMSVPFMTTDSAVFVQPLQLTDLTILEFNQTHYAEIHGANIEISNGLMDQFDPIAVDHVDTVSPVLPSMRQTTVDAFSYSRTYFFLDETF